MDVHLYGSANDPRTANDSHIRAQMIPKKSKEWRGGWNSLASEKKKERVYFY